MVLPPDAGLAGLEPGDRLPHLVLARHPDEMQIREEAIEDLRQRQVRQLGILSRQALEMEELTVEQLGAEDPVRGRALLAEAGGVGRQRRCSPPLHPERHLVPEELFRVAGQPARLQALTEERAAGAGGCQDQVAGRITHGSWSSSMALGRRVILQVNGVKDLDSTVRTLAAKRDSASSPTGSA